MSKFNKEKIHNCFQKYIKRGDKSDFDMLYFECYDLVFKIAFSYLKNKENSEDIAQQTFLKIYHMPKEKLPTNNETSWLYTVVKNESLDLIRKNKNQILLEDLSDISNESKEISDIEDMNAYLSFISHLKEEEKEIVTFKIIGGFSFKEIASILKKPIGTIQWKYYQALHDIKLIITNFVIATIAISAFVVKKLNQKVYTPQINMNEQNNMREEESNTIENEKQNDMSVDSKPNVEANDTVEQNTIQTSPEPMNSTVDTLDMVLLAITGAFLILSILFATILKKFQQKSFCKPSK